MSDLGRFTWYELMSTDPQGALDFYRPLVGWGHQRWEGEMPYDLLTRDEQMVAGVMQLPEEAQAAGAPTHWLGYVHTDDIDATVAQAEELGGKVMHRMDLPQVGRIAVAQDPQGAMICFFQPVSAPGPEHDPEPGEFSWHELQTTDWEAAWEFYSALFGWEVVDDMDMGEAGTYRMFGRGGRTLGGMMNKPPQVPVACWTYYAKVDSVDEAAPKIAEMGGQVMMGPMDVPGGDRILYAIDPQGGAFAFHAAAQKAAEA